MLREARNKSDALRPVTKFRKYKVLNGELIREFYFLLRAAVKGARALGHWKLKFLINEQTIPSAMGKMPAADWKQWVVDRQARE
jgi:hypothetical protein